MTTAYPCSEAFDHWLGALPHQRRYGGLPPKGVIAAALIVLERLKGSCDLTLAAHLAPGGAQIAGISRPALAAILARHGENRLFVSEAGRTNRGNNTPIRELLETLHRAGLAQFSPAERRLALERMQARLVELVDGYFRMEALRFDFDPAVPARVLVRRMLDAAEARQQSGPVAQHLVGAKLALRFPEEEVGNWAYSAADEQSRRSGDFEISNTAFHVTVAPQLSVVQRCNDNVANGMAAILLVPDAKLGMARALIESENLGERIAAESIESFVGQNISELARFSRNQVAHTFYDLLHEYNRRVSEVESDSSLRIEIPRGVAPGA